jgi:hypothetical protein
MHLTTSDGSFRFEAKLNGKEEFASTCEGLSARTHIVADCATDIQIDVGAYDLREAGDKPHLVIELFVDGILRNVIKPSTGRGLADRQFAEAKLDRGLVLTSNSMPVLKKFRFVDLDLDDGKHSKASVHDLCPNILPSNTGQQGCHGCWSH